MFTKADEPLEADDWLRTMEHKFSLIQCSETQKPLFAAQQLRGAAGAWWENFLAIQAPGHQVTWTEFKDAFRAHYPRRAHGHEGRRVSRLAARR